MSPGSSVSILKTLASLEVPRLRCISPECPPRSLRGHAWFLTVVNGVFHVRNAICMSLGYSVSVFKYLASLVVSEFPSTVKSVPLLANTWVTLASDWFNFDGVIDDLPVVRFSLDTWDLVIGM